MVETSTGRTLPVYNAIDSTAHAAQLASINASLARLRAQLNFLSDLFGPYPFDSTGAVADRAAGVGYALEVQTKPHYSGGFTSGNPSINISTQLHEIAHQWVGNSVTLEAWADIWFNEGWAELVGVVLAVRVGNGGETRLTSSTSFTPKRRPRIGRSLRPSSTAIQPTCSAPSRPTTGAR